MTNTLYGSGVAIKVGSILNFTIFPKYIQYTFFIVALSELTIFFNLHFHTLRPVLLIASYVNSKRPTFNTNVTG